MPPSKVSESPVVLLLARYDRMREKERVMQEFYSTFDPSVLAKRQKGCAAENRGETGAGASAVPNAPKEEPFDELSLDLENRRYNFFCRTDAAER